MPQCPAATPSLSSRRKNAPESIDLDDVPLYIQPTPPTNTLLITNLNDPLLFLPHAQQQLKTHLCRSAHSVAWAPLKSFRRVVAVFASTEDALAVRKQWDGQYIMDNKIRIYFGENTPDLQGDQHLSLPDAGKLLFISPPPSPPEGWESSLEDPPNAQTLAHDLAHALERLSDKAENYSSPPQSDTQVRSSSPITLLKPQDSTTGLGVVVSDLSDASTPTEQFQSLERKKVHTAMPPIKPSDDT